MERKYNIVKECVNIEVEINGLNDLLKMIDDYPIADNIEYNIDMEVIHRIKGPLRDLDSMIGMNELKNSVVDQIIYYVQNFHNLGKCDGDFMHTVIYGPPGTGKTEIAKIIGKIFSKLGILKKGTFRKVTRSDLVAGYLGQTAIKTRDVIKNSLGGVLFIDEAYALGNSDKRDSFAKECIDTLCEALSDHKDNIMVIIAGYEKELKECFFNYNNGLESRFTWRFKTDDYSHIELREIFIKKVNDAGWIIDEKILTEKWFMDNKEYFKYYGRDMETLFAKTKICHSRRVFCKPMEEKTHLTIGDIHKGFELYIQNDEVKSRKDKMVYSNMYV
jgi:SpoVK/Ycf46/Vps4 family AAA+-type ATPase